MNAKTPGFMVELGSGQEPLELGGWSGIEGLIDDQKAKAFQAQLDHASLYRQTFATTAGRYVLEDLMQQFLRQRIVRPDDTQFAAGIRQGQADAVQRILAMIEFANQGGGIPTGPGATITEG